MTAFFPSLSAAPVHPQMHTSPPSPIPLWWVYRRFLKCVICVEQGYFVCLCRTLLTFSTLTKTKIKGKASLPVGMMTSICNAQPFRMLSVSVSLHTILIYLFISSSLLEKVKSKLQFLQYPQKEIPNKEVSVSIIELSSTEIISRSFYEAITCLTRTLVSWWSDTRT